MTKSFLKSGSKSAIALALGLAGGAGLVAASPAIAQQAAAEAAPRKFDISAQARKPLAALQTAVNAKDYTNLAALSAEAKAKAKTADDKYMIAQLELRVANDKKDMPGLAAALEAMLASGGAQAAELPNLYLNLGKIRYQEKNYAAATQAFDQLLKVDPNNVEGPVLLAEALAAQNQPGKAIELFEKAIAARVAAGQKVDESWYKRAVALAYNNKLPQVNGLTRGWVEAYPSPTSWRDTLRIYQQMSTLEDSDLLDIMRLSRSTKSLAGESDYYRLANGLMLKGFPGEALAILNEGFASGAISKTSPTFSGLYAKASANAKGDRASLDATARTALAAASAKQAVTTADAYYGYGDFAKAADLYKAALAKSGVDKDTVQLRLGMALAGMGDKAGAVAALNAVGGTKADIARYWLLHLATRG